MTLSFDENLLVTDDGRKLAFVPYTNSDSGPARRCGNRACALYNSRCGGLFYCVSRLRKNRKNGYWKEAE